MKKKNAGNLLIIVLLLIQLAAEGVFGFLVYRLNILTGLFFGLMAALLVLGLAVTGLIGLLKIKGKKKAVVAFRRSVAAVLAVLISALSVYGSMVVWQVTHTLDKVTDNKAVMKAAIDVFVQKDDPAETIKDAASYSFGYLKMTASTSDMKAAMEDIESQTDTKLNTVEFENNIDMADALLSGKVQAIIMSPSYVSLIEDQEGYGDFSEKTRVLYEYQIKVKAEDTKPKNEVESITTTPFVLYLSGSDTRSQFLDVSRSDVNILAVINPKTKKVLLVNTPRDYYVPISVSDYTENDKLTHCGIYGIQCSMDTLSHLYDIPVNYYGQINFTGFEKLVDAVGGINVYSDVAFTSSDGVVSISAGDNYLNGAQALAFARERYALSGGDNDRGKNQMKVLQAVVDKLSAQSVLLNYADILSSMSGMFATDVSSDDISKLIKMQLSDMSKWEISSTSVTGTGGSDVTYSMPGTYAYVTYPDEASVAQAKEAIRQVMEGQ